MNPWEIVSWVGAAAVAVLIVAVTFSMLRSLIKPSRSRDKTTKVMTTRT